MNIEELTDIANDGSDLSLEIMGAIDHIVTGKDGYLVILALSSIITSIATTAMMDIDDFLN